jgi:hypothetical protein
MGSRKYACRSAIAPPGRVPETGLSLMAAVPPTGNRNHAESKEKEVALTRRYALIGTSGNLASARSASHVPSPPGSPGVLVLRGFRPARSELGLARHFIAPTEQ